MHSNTDVWVVVPTYNEEPVVGEVIGGLLEHFPNVVAVDDGSVDRSAEEIRRAGARLVQHPINMGAGAAMQTGIDFALLDPKMRYVVTFDADGQHRVEDAVQMVERARESGVEVVIGSRFLGADAVGMSFGKRALLKTATVFERLTSGIQLTDAHQGLRVFDRSFASVLEMRTADMAWASEFLQRMFEVKATYEEYPVTVAYTDYSRAKGQRSVNSINIGVDVLVNRILRGHR
ncbi:glycosyltransferase family 2 protein [Phycicoccus sp. M110.8]|uniref:glycosyltransferase family 2 protein n=1 Tax=Phycicoccus sp. M110.8 TaxID=3075433 RepID=UPI0028FD23F8|nr:glycosyltransferase family 2 protein [Phycicoccus sp. M110.8]MDU0312713.1 glycosyltransferase family 2 protein [Phycicoccus sp. M110.8]